MPRTRRVQGQRRYFFCDCASRLTSAAIVNRLEVCDRRREPGGGVRIQRPAAKAAQSAVLAANSRGVIGFRGWPFSNRPASRGSDRRGSE